MSVYAIMGSMSEYVHSEPIGFVEIVGEESFGFFEGKAWVDWYDEVGECVSDEVVYG